MSDLDQARETNQRLNRRNGELQRALADAERIIAAPPGEGGARFVDGSTGRAFLAWHNAKLTEERDAARGAARRLLAALQGHADDLTRDEIERIREVIGGDA